MIEFFSRELGHSVSEVDLRGMDRKSQLEVMRSWFYDHFEDPAERTPYESAEGGYIWIHGGPYDARWALQGEFSALVAEDVVAELASELEAERWEWAPVPTAADYDEYLIEDIARITEYYHHFAGAILDIEKLLEMEIHTPVAGCFLRLLYVNVITALETYLSDAFISTVVKDTELMRRFIEHNPKFQAEKIPLSDVFKAVEQIERKARSCLIETVWHHLERVKPMFRDILEIELIQNPGPIYRAILNRHDIVHRNGRTKDGTDLYVDRATVEQLIRDVQAFVQHVDSQLSEFRAKRALGTISEGASNE